jgi:magnesium-transporting ATPase (P-type)
LSQPGTQNLALPKARLGRWSIVMAVISVLLLAASVAGIIMTGNQDPGSAVSGAAFWTTVAAIWLSRLCNLVGVVLGVIGFARRDRYTATVGLILNVAIIFFGDWLAGQIVLYLA